MAATSVTGVGPGMSNGLYKQANNSGCCGSTVEAEEAQPLIKRGCHTRHTACGTGSSYKANCSFSHKTCC